MPSRIDFVASATENISLNAQGGAAAMPSVDGSNTDCIVTNNSAAAVGIQFGTVATLTAGVGLPGSLTIQPGQTMLFTTSTIAASAASPPNVFGSATALAASATFVAAGSVNGTISLTVSRGTASAKTTF